MATIQSVDYLAIAPPLVLALAALAVLLVDAFLPRSGWTHAGALGGVLVAAGMEVVLAIDRPHRTFCVGDTCSFVVDTFTVLFQSIMLVAGVVVVLMARAEVRDTRLPAGEFYLLLLSALAGALTLAAGRDLVILVVSLEVVSLPLFALVALRRYDGRSTEAGLKMFLVSVISTAVMLFGISLIYGATGTMFLDAIPAALRRPGTPGTVAATGVVLILVGFGFKVSAVPFHFWAPDTYQGAPVAVAAFLSVVSKAAGFAGLILILTVAFGPLRHVWGPLVAILAAVTMTAGNLVALRQRTAMRLLAWSSIAQAGYMLAPLGVAAASTGDPALRELTGATVGYVAIYSVMNLGVFTVISLVGWVGQHGGGLIDDYRGLARSHPATAVALAFFLACLAGLPPGLAGLFAKIVVFRGVLSGGYGWLAVIMAVNTVIGLYYYLAWASRLFGQRPDDLAEVVGDGGRVELVHFGRIPAYAGAAIMVAAAGTLLVSVVPQVVLGVAPGG
jgi:NADH-quinone oxidoreductase subunit N